MAGHKLQHGGDLSPWVPGVLQWPLCACHTSAFTNPGSWWYRTNNHSTANPVRKQNTLLVGAGGWAGAMHRWGTRARQVGQCQHAQPQDNVHSTPGPRCQCRNVLSLMVTEIRSLLGTQARLALPRVLGGNQALIDLYLTSAFKILSLWSNKH